MRFRHDRRRFLALSGAACLAAPALARGAPALAHIEGGAFGTGWRISLPDVAETGSLRMRVENLLADLDLAFSPWRGDSAISRFNSGAARDMAVSPEIAEVTREALAVADASEGRFDPTVGPLVARWGFGPIHQGRAGGWQGLAADDRHISKANPALTLDLCGIAKGHALDRVTALLLDGGHDHFLADLGGELAARGRHPSGRIWQVGIEDPRREATSLAGVLLLDGMAVATSGDRANGYDIGGRRFSHIIDPTSGEPVESRLASVSVRGATARQADGWATALMAAGDAGPELAKRQGLPALFLFREGGGLRRAVTGRFMQHLV
ncbi:FAD:protein FMN transferase [Aquamicrobium segne]|uniref:FAD:protein FMN transferase n=1 Tax=Aquamicrobium segne TaxID=469547 RepID=A0ABW0H124_9HYPH